MIELIMVIVLLGILSATVYVKWPTGMEEVAAAKEFKRAVRYAQHKAMTREFTTAGAAWGIVVSGDQYTVQKADSSEQAETEFVTRCLNSESKSPCDITLTGGPLYFNGLGEPLDASGDPITGEMIFTIGASTHQKTVKVSPATGYVN
jgi:type II secretory pathway pseudopilin PulG